MRMKKIFTLILSVALVLNCNILSFAATKDISTIYNTISKKDITEIQDYMRTHQMGLELEEQTQTYNIPLSNGENAIVEISLVK